MKNVKFNIFLLLTVVFISSCKKKELANVTINEAEEITENSAKISFEIMANKKSTVGEFGVVWDTVANPTTSNNKLIVGSGVGNYSAILIGLNTSTTYFVRVYAINSTGTAYSSAVSFTTEVMDITTPGPVVDFDGYEYPTVVLGNGQEWMTNNLRNSNYANGDVIPNVQDSSAWSGLNTGAWVHYNNDVLNENPFGKLYNWYAVDDTRGLCPGGWHVPSAEDYQALIDYAGGIEHAGALFTNELGGERWVVLGMFNYGGQVGFWWSSTPFTAKVSTGQGILMPYANPAPNHGFAVRCIKN